MPYAGFEGLDTSLGEVHKEPRALWGMGREGDVEGRGSLIQVGESIEPIRREYCPTEQLGKED